MNRTALHCALAATFAVASGIGYAQAPAAPAAPPIWKQGMSDSHDDLDARAARRPS